MNIRLFTSILVVIFAYNVATTNAFFNMNSWTGTAAETTETKDAANETTNVVPGGFVTEEEDQSDTPVVAAAPKKRKTKAKAKVVAKTEDEAEGANSKTFMEHLADQALESQGIAGGQETIHALHGLTQGKIPNNKQIDNIAKMVQNKGVKGVTDEHITLAKDAAKFMKTGEGDINAIAAQASTMVSELAAAKGYIAPEHAAAAQQGIEALKNRDAVGLTSALAKVLVHQDVIDGTKDLNNAIKAGSYTGMAAAGIKMLSGASQSRAVPATFRAPLGGALLIAKGLHTSMTTGSPTEGFKAIKDNLGDLEGALPVPAGSFKMLHKAATAVSNGESLQSVAMQMGQDEVLRRASVVPGLSTVLGSVMGGSKTVSLVETAQVASASPDLPTTQFKAAEIQILHQIIAEYASQHNIPLDASNDAAEAVQFDETVAQMAKAVIRNPKTQAKARALVRAADAQLNKTGVKLIAQPEVAAAGAKRKRRVKKVVEPEEHEVVVEAEPEEEVVETKPKRKRVVRQEPVQTVVQPIVPLPEDNAESAKVTTKAAKRRARAAALAAAKSTTEV